MLKLPLLGLLCLSLGSYGQECFGNTKTSREQQDATCRTYNECINNRLQVSTCRQGLIFYEALQKCVVEGSYKCGGLNFRCPQANGDFRDPTDCTRYYKCTDYIPLRRNCAAGDVFNDEIQSCDFQDDYNVCKNSGGSDIISCPASGNGKIADTSDTSCNNYYECINFQSSRRTCPYNQLFYPGFNQCVLADSYRCGGWGYSCPQQDGNFPDNTNSANFYHCIRGYPLLRRCKQGEVFDAPNARCTNRVGPINSRCRNQQISCSSGQSGNYSDPSDPTCRFYFECRNFQPSRVQCPNNFVYYPGLKKCVLPDSYRCNDPNPFVCPEPDADYPDNQNCRRFYYCLGYCPLHRTCNGNQVYNGEPNFKKCVDQSLYSCPYPSFK